MKRFCKACRKPTKHKVFVESFTGLTRMVFALASAGGTEILLDKTKQCQRCGRTTKHDPLGI